jgi:hypothetical protein
MAAKEPWAWETYEEVARFLLEEMSDTLGIGLERVEGEQKLAGKSGTKWQVDAKGVKTEDGAIVIVECRRWTTSKPDQEDVGAFAYRIGDVGAAGGIVVTPLGVQEGGQKIAEYEGTRLFISMPTRPQRLRLEIPGQGVPWCHVSPARHRQFRGLDGSLSTR